jgi:predicted MPP superfamily phosphohydrolase
MSRSFKVVLKLLTALVVFAGLCAADAFLVEPYFPRVIRQEVVIRNLPKSLDGFKIVHLSDLHIVKLGAREKRALRLIRKIDPDIVCLTGDYVEDDGITPGEQNPTDCAKEAAKFISALPSKYGVYAVHGNWDGPVGDPYLARTGAHFIDNQAVDIAPGLTVAGAGGLRKYSKYPVILLDHFPYSADDINSRNVRVDLMLAGHWHGGQVGFPLRMNDVKYLSGLYTVGDTQLYVTRGLGMHSLAVRFNCPSEVTLIVLRAGTPAH